MIDFEIKERFQRALDELADKGKRELLAEGHRASGRGIDSLEGKITEQGFDKLVGVILANDYLIPVDTSVSAARVPYNRGSGAGRSAYIEGLLDWVDIIKPGLVEKEKRSFVFAIAATHKRDGIPSKGSYSYTQNGRRTGWIENSFETEQAEKDFEEALDLINYFTLTFERALINIAA